MNILITGANGFVGKNLLNAWKGKHNIYALSRSSFVEEGISRVYTWDRMEEIAPVDVIIHLAAKAHDTKNLTQSDEYSRVNTDLTGIIFDYFMASKAKTFIFFSSVKAVRDTLGETILTEQLSPSPVGPYGISKRKAEEYILGQDDHLARLNKRAIIFRPSMIHGPGNKGNFNLLFELVKKGFPWPLGSFDNKRSFCSIDNLIYVVDQIIQKEETPSGIYNVCDDTAVSTNDLIMLISSALNQKSRMLYLPKKLLIGLARIGTALHLPLTTERLNKLTENYVVSNEKIKTTLGTNQMPTSAQDGLIKTINSFKQK